jgi:5'-nucleotidase/UDP-sugar diphosphatase
LSKNNIAPFTVIDRPDAKIGIIGLANPDVVNQSKACKDTKFVNPFKAVKESVKALQTQKVNIIIVLSHLGLPFDEELAKNVSGVDLIVGGHTHDYIGPGSPLGPYPIV